MLTSPGDRCFGAIMYFAAVAYFAWAAATNFPWETDGDDLGDD
jgi:hypothetical protein